MTKQLEDKLLNELCNLKGCLEAEGESVCEVCRMTERQLGSILADVKELNTNTSEEEVAICV